MIQLKTCIQRFSKKGEKTSWSYIEIPPDVAEQLNPGVRKSYRIKGKIDAFEFSGLNVLPMGEGHFILPINAGMRRSIRKKAGDNILVQLEFDPSEYKINTELLEALESDPNASSFFNSLTRSHQNYFSKWIESAKTQKTRFDRISDCFMAMIKKQGYPEMIREKKLKRDDY